MKPTEKNDGKRLKDILKRMKDGEEISKEDDDFYDKKYVEYVKRTGSGLGFRESIENDDGVDDDVETETKPEKPKKETLQEKHNNDAYETEDEDGDIIYVSETIDYDVFKESLESPREHMGQDSTSIIHETKYAKKRFKESIEDPKFQKKFQKLVSKTVGLKFEDGQMDHEDFDRLIDSGEVRYDEDEKYDNWEDAVHYTFAKHPDKFKDVPGLEDAIELQNELNDVRKKNFDEANYMWRGMNIRELEIAGKGTEDPDISDQSWSVDYEAAAGFFDATADDNPSEAVLVRIPKETSGMYDINYSVLKEDDHFSPFTTQGMNYLFEDEYRLKNRDMSNIMGGIAMILDHGMSEDERLFHKLEAFPKYQF